MRIVRHLLIAAAFPAAAFAADPLPADAEVSAAVGLTDPVHVWSGPYAGGFVGYSVSDFDQSGGADFDGEGFVGGVYTGYNFQTDRLVYGLEADLGYSGLDAGGFDAATGAPLTADGNAFGSLRARVGVAYDPFLFFATGGVAVANTELTSNGVEDDNTHFGYTVGAGVETQVTDDIAARLEYRYSDFESKTYDFGSTATSAGFDENSIRAGLALKF
ncbi:MAG: porin family protein [Rhizobiaceae bacterium]|nr:porin family protein [Rhizobiaceae bacterium]